LLGAWKILEIPRYRFFENELLTYFEVKNSYKNNKDPLEIKF
jgi:hypothetical protein